MRKKESFEGIDITPYLKPEVTENLKNATMIKHKKMKRIRIYILIALVIGQFIAIIVLKLI